MVFTVIKAGKQPEVKLTPAQKAARVIEVMNFIRNNPRIARWSIAVRARAGERCEECGNTHAITAHHIHELRQIVDERDITTPEQALNCAAIWDIGNGIALCPECHAKRHGGRRPSST